MHHIYLTLDSKLSKHFDELAKRRDGFRRRGNYYHSQLERFLRFLIPEGQRVLELGSGTGHTLASLKPSYGVGVDISSEMVSQAKSNHPSLHFLNQDAENLELKEVFDSVLLVNTIGYFEDIQMALGRIRGNVSRETRIVLVYFNFLWKPLLAIAEILRLRMPGKERHWLPISDIENLLDLAGFEVIRKEARVLIPIYIPIISWFFNTLLVHLPLFRWLALNTFVIAKLKAEPEIPPPSVTVVVPCRNERGNIEQAIQRMPEMGSHTEVIYVEGNSSDGTYEECLRVRDAYPEWDIKVFKQPGKGKGDAVRKGFGEASGDILMILDADLTVPPEDLPKFFEVIASGKGEFVNGSRLVYNMESEAMRPLNLAGNKFFSWAFTFLLSQRLRDTLCGTKVLSKKNYEKIIEGRSYFGDFDPFGDFDLLFGAAKLNLKIVEIPIRYRNRTYGSTQISRFSHGWLLIKMTFFALRRIKFV